MQSFFRKATISTIDVNLERRPAASGLPNFPGSLFYCLLDQSALRLALDIRKQDDVVFLCLDPFALCVPYVEHRLSPLSALCLDLSPSLMRSVATTLMLHSSQHLFPGLSMTGLGSFP